jgi:DNA-binding MurR/RpiR family transcriptional regulator
MTGSESHEGVVDAILQRYEDLSDAEKAVADFILTHKGTVSSLSAVEIARLSGISNTTVSRFVRSLGYASFADMRYALAREETASKERSFDDSRGIGLSDVQGSLDYVLETKIEELRSTFAALSEESVVKAVGILSSARIAMFVGVGSSLPVAQGSAIKFSQAGVNAISPSTSDGAMITASLMQPDDCLVVISNSGRSDRLRKIMSNAIDRGVSTIVITRNAESPLAERADVVLKVVSRDHLLVNDFDFSHNSINYVLESLLLLLFHSSRDANEYNLELFNRTIASEKEG